MNSRFTGSWVLRSYELRRPDGAVECPLGERPVGMFSWDAAGWFAVQLGPDNGAGEGYLAFYGTWDAPDSDAGVMWLRVVAGSAPQRVAGELSRNFAFLEPDVVRMRPPVNDDGSQATILWQRAAAAMAPSP